MVLPPSIPTLEALSTGNYTRVDNVFVSRHLVQRIKKCDTVPEQRPPKTDHIPIITILDLQQPVNRHKPAPNWKKANWKAINEFLEANAHQILGPPIEFTTEEEYKEACENMDKLRQTIEGNETLVPSTKPSPQQCRWWNNELAALRQTTNEFAR
ncbi:hypothetical protein K435DRAFT_616598, partial [Dendrothele bispora CBS 962.96]